MVETATVTWTEEGQSRQARWLSDSGAPAPRQLLMVDDRTKADEAYGLAGQGTGLMWRGDFHNARQLLTALASRIERQARRSARRAAAPAAAAESFHRHRQAQAQRARTLGALLILLETDYTIPLRRAPDARQACLEVFGPGEGQALVSLRALLGVIGAHQWRVKGIEVPAAGGRIHPHYGVFAPIRAEYVELVASAPLPAQGTAFDIGTGTGVLAAVLARRGIGQVVATDLDPRALACARENFARLGIAAAVELVQADLFPPGRAQLIVCNPPWLPARPSSPLERGIYDPDSQMLSGFLEGLAAHLAPGGEGWLVLSDLAERLGLRTRAQLLGMIAGAGLEVIERSEARPSHRKSADVHDPLHRARAAEVTSLWRLRAAGTASAQ